MITKTDTMLYLGAGFTGLATAMFASPFVGRELASALGIGAALVFAAFAFQPVKRAIAMVVTIHIWGFGLTYYSQVRQDMLGIGVLLACALASFAIAWPHRRRGLHQG